MIETKEEYAQTWALINGQDRQVAKDFHATIEALRDVARAGRLVTRDLPASEVEIARECWGNTNTALISLRLADTLEALAALPDWLTDG